MNIATLKHYIAEVIATQYRGGRYNDAPHILRQGIGVRPNAGNHLEIDDSNDKKAVTTLIVSKDGLVLAVSRKDDHTMWSMPGGKVDPGETPVEAASRELKEETGLDAHELSPIHSAFDGEYVCTTFACDAEGAIDTEESGLIRWVTPQVLCDPESSPFYEYNRELFRDLGYI